MAATVAETCCENLVNKIHHKNEVHFVGYLYIMDMIKERTMEHFKVTLHLPRKFCSSDCFRTIISVSVTVSSK